MDFNLDSIQKQPVSDDPELAKALAGLNGEEGGEESLQFEGLEPAAEATPAVETEAAAPVVAPVQDDVAQVIATDGSLDEIKVHALQDLRPLMEKLDVSAEEKFNIYLLLLRSSDDKTLIEPAYAAARNIEDETKRANALLDVIKEIDYLNAKTA
ncbi:MAG: hypothetical protein Q4A21_00095 [bacterium]|nr:hypothetical protein [bacterium]